MNTTEKPLSYEQLYTRVREVVGASRYFVVRVQTSRHQNHVNVEGVLVETERRTLWSVYVAWTADLPGVSFTGNSAREALQSLERGAREYDVERGLQETLAETSALIGALEVSP